MMLGRVDEVDGHFVATKFVALAIPTECRYVPRVNPRATMALPEGGFRIRTDWRSVFVAYGRLWLPFLAVAIPVAQAAFGHIPVATWMLSAAIVCVSVVAYGSGRLPEKEKERLRLLGTVTGLRIDPARLLMSTRDAKRDSLGELMAKGGIPVTADGILSVLPDIPLPALPLVYGFACYAGDGPEWRECAALVHARYEQSEF